jgi:hypothetical protein
MPITRRSLFGLTLLLAAGGVGAQTADIDAKASRDSAWFSYRDTYQAMIRFEKYGKPKQFIQSQLQVIPKDKTVSIDGLRLVVNGKSTHVNLPLDPLGRTVFPLLKAAYDENAELQINRAADAVRLEQRVSLQPRVDGIYEMTDLRSGCDQVLQYLRYIDYPRYRSMQCSGVKFSYLKESSDIVSKFRNLNRVLTQLSVTEGDAFLNDANNSFKLVVVRFSDWPEQGQVVTNGTPLAIAAMLE